MLKISGMLAQENQSSPHFLVLLSNVDGSRSDIREGGEARLQSHSYCFTQSTSQQ